MAEPQARLDVVAAFVGAAMMLRFVHARQHVARDFAFPARFEYSGYAAHGSFLRLRDRVTASAVDTGVFRAVLPTGEEAIIKR